MGYMPHETQGPTYTTATQLQSQLRQLINRLSLENGSNTPDFILADYLIECLNAFDRATRRSKDWTSDSERMASVSRGRP